jgi:hypothetical protein
MVTPDQIGRLGELVVEIGFSRPVAGTYRRRLFRPTFLGDKYPSVDYLVDVINEASETVGFFFAQVRSTMRERRSDARLAIKLDAKRYGRLVELPIPTYLIGVDLVHEAAFIVVASKQRITGVSSISTKYSLAEDSVRSRLYEEVCGFWGHFDKAHFRSEFHDG